MAGGVKTLNAWVVLGGRIDNSFTALGQNLVMLGSSIDGISQKLINFGKESITTYRNYEDSMLEAQVALATNYGKGSAALKDVMSQLDRQASEWAATTIFHTDDVASAIAEAAHANWDLDKILEGMPAAMRLAQAGSLDLSTGLDYIIKSTNAAGISFDDLSAWVDEWTYAANSSAGTVEEFGEAMLKMGATMKFADNKEELLTMLATLHDAGTTGTNAGTLLRNTMIRLVAPTKKASDAMEELGVAQSDIDEALGETDGDLTAALKLLGDLGFSAYDSSGNLKDMTTIFEELYKATSKMTDQEKLGEIWSAIFPTRTITGAMSLIEAAGKNWNGLLDELNGGAASGYGQYAADTMMSGLTGSVETFNSKVEDLRKELGQQLAPQLENIVGNFGKVIDLLRKGGEDNGVSSGLDWLSGLSDIIGGLADNMDGMDPAVFDALVAGLGALAAIGPTLLTAGFTIRALGWGLQIFTSTPVGKIVLAAAALGIIFTTLEKYNESKFLENFGNMNIDTTNLDASMERIKTAFEKGTEPTERFAKALDDSVKNYETAAEKFSATMMEDLLKDQTLTGEDLEKKLAEYRTLGSDMVGALKEGITNSADMSAEFWMKLFKGQNGTDEDLEKNEVFAGIIKALDEDKSTALDKATAIGDELQKAITAAWEDGNLDPEERDKIKEYFRQLNEAMAQAEMEAQNEADYIKRKQMLDMAQGMSYQQMTDYVQNTIMPQRQEELDWYENHYKAELYRMQYRKEEAEKNGDLEKAAEYDRLINGWDDESGHHAGAQEVYENARAGVYSDYDNMIMTWYAATLSDSSLFTRDNGKGINALKQAASWLLGGDVTEPESLLKYVKENGLGDAEALIDYYQQEIKALGDVDEIKKRIESYRGSGDKTLSGMADDLENLLAIYSILSPYSFYFTGNRKELSTTDYEDLYAKGYFGQYADYYLKALLDSDYSSEFLTERYLNLPAVAQGMIDGMAETFGQLYDVDMINALFNNRDLELDPQLRDDFALAMLLGMSEGDRQKYALGGAESNLFQAQKEYDETLKKYQDAYNSYHSGFAGSFHEGLTTTEIQALEAELKIKEQELAEAQAAYDAAMGTDKDTSGKMPQAIGFIASAGMSDVGGMGRPNGEGESASITEGVKQLDASAQNAGTELASTAQAADNTESSFNQFILMLDLGGSKAETFGDKVKGAGMVLDDASSYFLSVGAGLDVIIGSAGEASAGLGDVASGAGAAEGSMSVLAAGASSAAAALSSIHAPSIWSFLGLTKKAKGGRETSPAIFAEAGIPEWYIPEEHTANTAKLLIAAAANSGFSLIDLAELAGARLFAEGGTDGSGSLAAALSWGSLAGTGGGSADAITGAGMTVQYSPTIHANDAKGVEQALKEDKKRFKKFMEEFAARKELYESIAAYV